MKDPVLVARARVANATRRGDATATAAARSELTAAKLERAINEALVATPPLNTEQHTRLASLLAAGPQ